MITDADIATLTNTEVLAINQDALGQQAEYMEALSTGTSNYSNTGYDVYVKDLTDGRMAVSVTNRGTTAVSVPDIQLTSIYLKADNKYTCRDIWANTESEIENTLSPGTLQPCETKVYVLTDKATVTSLSGVNTSLASKGSTRYDISGRKVAEDYKGLSIKDGQKTLK